MLTIISVNNINWPYRKLYMILYTNIDQHLVNSLHGLNCEIGGLGCRVITTEYYSQCPLDTHVTPTWQCVGPSNLFGVSGQCCYTILSVDTSSRSNIYQATDTMKQQYILYIYKSLCSDILRGLKVSISTGSDNLYIYTLWYVV